jgi:hypothetical protein
VKTRCDPIEYIDSGREFCLILRNVEIGRVGTDRCSHELSLPNVTFPTDKPNPIALAVPWGASTVPVSLRPLRNYQARIGHLIKTRGIVATAALRFHEADVKGGPIAEFISDLCLAISLVEGTKVNWIYHATYAPRRVLQHAVFGGTITKAYATSPLCYAPGASTAVTPALTAAQEAVPAIRQFREKFDPHNRLINSWLDARTQTDYLEGRTLKYAVVIEALNAITTHGDKTIARTVQDSKTWEQLYQEVVRAKPGLENSVSLPNWNRLNDRPFREVLSDVCACHRIALPLLDLKLFNSIRNNIVHRLNYDLKIKLPSGWTMPNSPQAGQHYFVAHFVDRIVLELFGLRAHLDPVSGPLANCQRDTARK